MIEYKVDEKEVLDYNLIEEGLFSGVYYKITDAKIVEEDGQTLIQFDYDAKGLDEGNEAKFEEYIGQLLIDALKRELQKDMSDEEIEKLWH